MNTTKALVYRDQPGVWITRHRGQHYITSSAEDAWRLVDQLATRVGAA